MNARFWQPFAKICCIQPEVGQFKRGGLELARELARELTRELARELAQRIF